LSFSVHQSSGRQPVEKGDEKKLIGYAQLSVIGSTMGSTVWQRLCIENIICM